MPKADIAVVRNHFFRDNSRKPELIGMTADFRCCSLNGWKMATKKQHFTNFIVCKAMHRFTHSPVDDFREVLTQNVTCCLVDSSKQNCEFFSKKRLFTSKTSFWGWFVALPVCMLQPWPLAPEQTWALHLIVELVFPHIVTFSYDLPFSRYIPAKSPLFGSSAKVRYVSAAATVSAC